MPPAVAVGLPEPAPQISASPIPRVELAHHMIVSLPMLKPE